MFSMIPTKNVVQAMDTLPAENVTVMALKALDFVVPGQWQNTTGFHNMIRTVTNEQDPARILRIQDAALRLYNEPAQGYQRTLWLYQTVDKMDQAVAAAVMAQKAGEAIPFLSFLAKLTPKADTSQAIDLALKLVVEAVAYLQLTGKAPTNVGEFVSSLQTYAGESAMRLAALVCMDGLIPLGPDFLTGTQTLLGKISVGELTNNPMFQRIGAVIPGASAGDKLGFVGESFSAAQGWINQFVVSRGLNQQMALGSLKKYVAIADDKLDYVSAFLDATTNYYEHTGTQTLARRLIERAAQEA